jgi:tripartite ATP-independent transporter DctP family solute receptor
MAKQQAQVGSLFAIILMFIGGCGIGDDERVLKLGHDLPTAHPVHHAMVAMAEGVEEKSDGKLRIKIYSDGQLGPERVLLELIQIGSLAMTKVSAATLAAFVPPFGVLEMPYLFEDREHRFAALEGPIGERLLDSGRDVWLQGLTFYDAGSRSFYTCNRPVAEPADLAGQKIRVMESRNSVTMTRLLGASPTPISFGELYTALQQGVVDGAENNPPSFVSSRHYEVCSNYALDEHTSIPDVVVISTRIWDSLSAQEQAWIREAAHESAELQKILWERSERQSLETAEAAGVTISYPDKEPFQQAVAPMYDALRQDQPALYEIVQAIRRVAEEREVAAGASENQQMSGETDL